MTEEPIKQIFVVGRHRSGTTFFTNALSCVEGVYTPSAALHHGQIESGFFSSLAPYFNNGASASDRVALIQTLAESDYFKALDLPKSILSADWSHIQLFETIMAKSAKAHQCDCWIEKSPSHSLMIDDLQESFPHAEFVWIKRHLVDQTVSCAIGLMSGATVKNLFISAFVTGIYDTVLCGAPRQLPTSHYEDLKSNFHEEMQKLLVSVGLGERAIEYPRFKPNSSYTSAYSDKSTPPNIGKLNRILIYIGYFLARLTPRAAVLKSIAIWRRYKRKNLPNWMFAKHLNLKAR